MDLAKLAPLSEFCQAPTGSFGSYCSMCPFGLCRGCGMVMRRPYSWLLHQHHLGGVLVQSVQREDRERAALAAVR